MLQSSSEALLKHQRFRQTVPSKAWRWKEVTGWAWRGDPEHINSWNTLKWLVTQRKLKSCRVLRLVDSMVVLHALSRGRSSSRKLRRTLVRVQAILLLFLFGPMSIQDKIQLTAQVGGFVFRNGERSKGVRR